MIFYYPLNPNYTIAIKLVFGYMVIIQNAFKNVMVEIKKHIIQKSYPLQHQQDQPHDSFSTIT